MNPLKRRIIIDGIRLEGDDARSVVRDALRAADEGKSLVQRLQPLVILLVLSMIIAGSAAWIIAPWLKRITGSGGSMWYVLTAGLTGFIIGGLWARWLLRSRRRELRRAMLRYGFELCAECGYWLKGLGDDVKRCPECGAPRETSPSRVAEDRPADT